MFTSYYEVKVTGRNVKRFIKQVYKMGIFLHDVKYVGKSVYIKLDKENYLKLLDVKTIYDVELKRLYGLARIKDLLLRNYIFVIFIALGFALLIFLTRVIQEVEVVHAKKEIRDLVYKELENRGIKKYRFIMDFDKQEQIAKEIIENNKDKIEWLEIERIGVKYVVRVEERIINSKEEKTPNRHIVAKKDGIITKIEASHGEIVKKINDYVKKGDIIISGNIMKEEEIKSTTSAEGIVFAEVWYQVDVEMPLYYNEVTKTGKKRKNVVFKFFNNEFSLFDGDKYKSKETDDIFSVGNRLLPITISYVEEEEVNVVDEIYTYDEAINKAVELAEEKLKAKLGADDKIISQKKLKTEQKGSTILVRVFFKVNEDITDFKEITEEDLKKEEQNEQLKR